MKRIILSSPKSGIPTLVIIDLYNTGNLIFTGFDDSVALLQYLEENKTAKINFLNKTG